jgi:hypothetical protein
MARAIREKCRQCSKLNVEEAQQKDCWIGQTCHVRRSYYRHRNQRNRDRKHQRQIQQGIIEAPVSEAIAAIVYFYRDTKESPLHAYSVEFWQGNARLERVLPVHCLGISEQRLMTQLVQILDRFNQKHQTDLKRFLSSVELHSSTCPIRPCPLHPHDDA